MVVDIERLTHAGDFMKAMRPSGQPQYGVLISGPNGVGKSAVGLLTYLACFAQGLPAVYIHDSSNWVDAARAGNGHDHLMEQLFVQNAGEQRASCCLVASHSPRLAPRTRRLTPPSQILSCNTQPFEAFFSLTCWETRRWGPRRR